MSDINGNPHVGEMKAITKADESNGHDMMSDQLFKVFAWLFHSE